MPPKHYTWKELERMSFDVSTPGVIRKFLSPGMTFEEVAPTHPYRSQIFAPNLTNDIQNENDRPRAIQRANLYNAFADYQSPYGIPVKVKTFHTVNPWDDVSIPGVLERAIKVLCSTTSEGRAKHEIVPVLGFEFAGRNVGCRGIYRPSHPSSWTLSLAGMKEIGLDLESLAATMGDALAMIIYKCGLAYFGPFFFRPMPVDSNEHTGSSTISLCISWVNFSIMDATCLSNPHAMKAMFSYWRVNAPCPGESPYLWNVFETAFISRGNSYCSITLGITPEEMMRQFVILYADLSDDLSNEFKFLGTPSGQIMR